MNVGKNACTGDKPLGNDEVSVEQRLVNVASASQGMGVAGLHEWRVHGKGRSLACRANPAVEITGCCIAHNVYYVKLRVCLKLHSTVQRHIGGLRVTPTT